MLSFHGLPRRTLDLGDPYHCHCQKTARLLARELGLTPEQWTLSRSSRASARRQWLQAVHGRGRCARLAQEGVRRVDVFCPGFVADCLETLEEIGIEGEATFLAAGGQEFHAIPCLNEHPRWIAALADLVLAQSGGLARAAARRRRRGS